MDFNTSHVTVYPNRTRNKLDLLEFQYISCYGLSVMARNNPVGLLNFNTSHVTVYQNLYSARVLLLPHFNTSHVTVYLFF